MRQYLSLVCLVALFPLLTFGSPSADVGVSFRSSCLVESPIQQVWQVLTEFHTWHKWFDAVEQVNIIGAAHRIGSIRELKLNVSQFHADAYNIEELLAFDAQTFTFTYREITHDNKTLSPYSFPVSSHFGSVRLLPLTCGTAATLTLLEWTQSYTTVNKSRDASVEKKEAFINSLFSALGSEMAKRRQILPHVSIYTSSNYHVTTITTRNACLYTNISVTDLWSAFSVGRDGASAYSTHYRPNGQLLASSPKALQRRIWHFAQAAIDGAGWEMNEVQWGIDPHYPSFTTSLDFSRASSSLRTIKDHLSVRSFHPVTFHPHTNMSLTVLLFTDSFEVPHSDITPIVQFQNWFTNQIFANIAKDVDDGNDLTPNKIIRRSFTLTTALRANLLWSTFQDEKEMTKIFGVHNVTLNLVQGNTRVWRAHIPNKTEAFNAYETTLMITETQREGEDVVTVLTAQIQFQLSDSLEEEQKKNIIALSHYFLGLSFQQISSDILHSVGQKLTHPSVTVNYPVDFLYRALTNFTNTDYIPHAAGAYLDDHGHTRIVILNNGASYRSSLPYFNSEKHSWSEWIETPSAFECDLYSGSWQLTAVNDYETKVEYTSHYVSAANEERVKEVLNTWADKQLQNIKEKYVADANIKKQADKEKADKKAKAEKEAAEKKEKDEL